MKSKLRLSQHPVSAGQNVIEVWYGGEFIGAVTGADGPGILFGSKHLASPDSCDVTEIPGEPAGVVEIILTRLPS